MSDSSRAALPRLRIFAGPNGSGKSTIKTELKPEWIGIFVNADEIERELRDTAGLDLARLGFTSTPAALLSDIRKHFRDSAFARQLGVHERGAHLTMGESLRLGVPGPYDSYLASVIADGLRRRLLAEGRTFTFETVMSSRDKIEFMREARERGYRIYLYFVATDDPAINLDRVRRRVTQGGHAVPEKKLRERYVRSIALLTEGCEVAHRTYVFDNSGSQHRLLAQIDNGDEMVVMTATLPPWFVETGLWRSFSS